MTPELPSGFAAFYQHVRDGQLCFPHCDDCGRHHWYPMKRCPHCRGERLAWVPVQGPGRLYSWTTVYHPFEASFADALPYTVGLIEFADAPGIRYVSNIIDAATMEIGMMLEPVFSPADAPLPMVRFRPA